MDIEHLLKIVNDALEDKKAKDIQVLDVRDMSNITDFMVVATGRSPRQVNALARHVYEQSKANGHQPFGEEGDTLGEWVLVDLGDVIVHVMQPQTREFYQLEKLWSKMGGDIRLKELRGAE
ncbi:ribosome silencing factor [Candidatus Parabeggiatoa sp. HSG14]|uniref:ribosome silencing factor n=1 Tax=Candidatus Parabeggiatoa sp. HSG14 TaxID=3055593 RepID=UPI0025A9241F|nr:ribosome silencing factor [Thiotrichales bacterium HSG14]